MKRKLTVIIFCLAILLLGCGGSKEYEVSELREIMDQVQNGESKKLKDGDQITVTGYVMYCNSSDDIATISLMPDKNLPEKADDLAKSIVMFFLKDKDYDISELELGDKLTIKGTVAKHVTRILDAEVIE